jgi:hypothetical protein
MQEHLAALLGRLDAIAASLARREHTLALIGLGSIGTELNRLDEYSDLDFFVIVEPGYKEPFIRDLGWLEELAPIAYSFQNTVDGHKVLFEDGIYAEFAVFEPDELEHIPADAGRVVWHADGVDPASVNVRPPIPAQPRTVDWLVGEILTNLYVGLMRLWRGERLSAERFIQVYAVGTLLELCALIATPTSEVADRFDPSRRFERRFPGVAEHLPDFLQGYERSPECALAILAFLERHVPVNAAIKQRIIAAAKAASPGG